MSFSPASARTPFISGTVPALFLFLSLLVAGNSLPARAQSGPSPFVSYSPDPGNSRQLIFVNNPERLELGYTDAVAGSVDFGTTYNDLADLTLGQKAIQRIMLDPGNYRDLFEHVYNLTRATTPASATKSISYAVLLRNPNTDPLFVTLYGKGFTVGTAGGQPLIDVFNSSDAQTYEVGPGRLIWLLRSDVDFGGTRPVNPGNFFSGVVDFDVSGGTCEVTNIAYQSLPAVTGKRYCNLYTVADYYARLAQIADMGFVTRRYSAAAAPESRVYKGLMSYPNTPGVGAGVVTNLTFAVDDTTVAGELPVTYAQYVADPSTGVYGPSATATVSGTGWYTHNTPLRDTGTIKVVGGDMFDIAMPGFGRVFALAPTVAPNTPFRQGNIGNWGIIYRDVVTLINNGAASRVFKLTLNNSSGSGSPIAYRDVSGAWQQTVVRSAIFPYYTVTVPAGTSQTVEGTFTLGCPGVGTIRHAVSVNAATP